MDLSQKENKTGQINGINEFYVEVEGFSGPLDLLCSLIESREIDVKKISVSTFVKIYSNFLYNTERASISAISDFITAAAAIVLGKVTALVPVRRKTEEENENEDDAENELLISEEKLAEMLERYRPYRYASFYLEHLKVNSDLCVKRSLPEDAPLFDLGDLYGIASLWWKYYETLFKNGSSNDDPQMFRMDGIPFAIPEEQQVENRMAELEEIIEEHKETDLRSILGDSPDISILVVTLLALLEMARLGRIKVIQERLFGNVRIVRNGNAE